MDQLIGIIILSIILPGGIVALFGFQWNKSHMFNPSWHPHSRFHTVQTAFFFSVLSLFALWLLWQRSFDLHLSAFLAALIPFTFWLGEFVALPFPGTHPSPDLKHLNTFSLFGHNIYGNLFFSGVMVLSSLLGYSLILRSF